MPYLPQSLHGNTSVDSSRFGDGLLAGGLLGGRPGPRVSCVAPRVSLDPPLSPLFVE